MTTATYPASREAQKVQSAGRGQDTMLVHMTPGEVGGLQALAMAKGGSLSINPETGLPEAGILSTLLPMAAGFALGPAGFGLMSSAMAGLTVGGLTALATGSLKKGLMAGLGAYGGAGLGEGLSAAGATAEGGSAANLANAPFTPAPTPTPVTPDMAFNPGVDFAAQTPLPGVAQTGSQGLLSQSMSAPQFSAVPGAPQSALSQAVASAPVPGVAPTGLDAITKGGSAMFQSGPAGEAARAAFMSSTPTGSLTAAGGSLAAGMVPPVPTAGEKGKSYIRPYDFSWNRNEDAFATTPTIADTSERRYFSPTYSPRPVYEAPGPAVAAAGGGLLALAKGGSWDDERGQDSYAAGGVAKKKKPESLGGDPFYKFADDRRDKSMESAISENFAAGGLSGALPPRFLSGGGDGMSDSIKANIDGRQEARLADGEFVVPADVVSHLGNGSSKAGAKKLYSMMDRIRDARTGRKSQAPEVTAEKYMPA